MQSTTAPFAGEMQPGCRKGGDGARQYSIGMCACGEPACLPRKRIPFHPRTKAPPLPPSPVQQTIRNMRRLLLSNLFQLRRCRGSFPCLPLNLSGNFERKPRIVTLNHAYSTEGGNTRKFLGRYPIPNKKDLPYDIVELMEEVEVKTGFLPNVFKVLSHRATEFRAFFAYYNAIMNKESGNLSKADKELIIVATSIVNKCPYCVVAHSALHRIYSKKPTLADQVIVNWKIADLTDRELAMLEFALAICRSENITEEHFQKLEAQGFDREDAWDIGTIAAFFAMSNRIAHFTDLHPNPEFYTLGRVPKDKEKAETS